MTCKKVAVIRLHPQGSAIGGEDQVGFYLCRAFEKQGFECSLFSEHESAVLSKYSRDFDLILSNGAYTHVDHPKACFWHFNERADLSAFGGSEISSLGYRHLFTNDPRISNFSHIDNLFETVSFLPLAADRSMIPDSPSNGTFEFDVAYVGNWNSYKGNVCDQWLLPLLNSDYKLAIFGGERWAQHPYLSKKYYGILPIEKWKTIRDISRTWISFRSPKQGLWGMVNDRVFWYMAAGVSTIISDLPKSDMLDGRVLWGSANTLKDDIASARRQSSLDQIIFASKNHLYDHRVSFILSKVL